ncbi:MAG: transcriptional regulator [Egibacteraceae bacterium]
MLQRLREHRGWTIPRLAEELRAKAKSIDRVVPARTSLIRMIREWEAGDHRPRAYADVLILVYATHEELAARTIAQGSELDQLMAAFEAMGIPVDRRKFLLNSAAIAAGLAIEPAIPEFLEAYERLAWMLTHPASVDLETIAHLRQRALDLLTQFQFGTTSSSTLIYAASQQLEQVTMLQKHAPSSSIREQLYGVEAHSATLLGMLVWDAVCRRDHTAAAHCYERAAQASAYVKGGWAEALPRIQQCLIAIYHDKDPKRALDLAGRAAICAGDGSSHVLAGESLAYVAEAHALLGNKPECERALDGARSHLRNVAPDDPALGRFTINWIGGFSGVCHLHLGDSKSAEVVLRESAQSLGDMEWQKTVILGDLAISLIRQRQPEQGAAVLHQAIDLLELTKYGGGVQRVFMAGRELRPWLGEPFAQDVADRLLALGSSAPAR